MNKNTHLICGLVAPDMSKKTHRSRIFEGIKYMLQGASRSKTEAKRIAVSIRKNGEKARVIEWGPYYQIYTA